MCALGRDQTCSNNELGYQEDLKASLWVVNTARPTSAGSKPPHEHVQGEYRCRNCWPWCCPQYVGLTRPPPKNACKKRCEGSTCVKGAGKGAAQSSNQHEHQGGQIRSLTAGIISVPAKEQHSHERAHQRSTWNPTQKLMRISLATATCAAAAARTIT